jgi:probable HAF family extracellular repeat protein
MSVMTRFGCIVLAASFSSTSWALSYQAAVIGSGQYSEGLDINNSGQATGTITFSPFLYSNGTLLSIAGSTSATYGASIDASGQVLLRGTGVPAYLYQSGTYTPLGALTGGALADAVSMNDSLEFAATIGNGTNRRAAMYFGGSLLNLGTFTGGGLSTAADINNVRQVTGTSSSTRGLVAFLYSEGTLIDLIPDAFSSNGAAVNDFGIVTGNFVPSSSPGETHGFVYAAGEVKDLGTLGGTVTDGLDINDAGQIVGHSLTVSGIQHAFIYSENVMYDLNDITFDASGGRVSTMSTATAINDRGQILARAGNTLLLLSPVPEAPAWLLLAFGVALVTRRTRAQTPVAAPGA